MKTFRPILLAGLLALAGASVASAQPSPTSPNAERLALARQIYAIIGPQTLSAMRQTISGAMANSLQSVAGQDPARAQAARVAMTDAMDRMMPKVLDGTMAIMAQDFSAEELRAILAFYQSPTGRALLEKMPEVGQQAVRLSFTLTPQMMRDFAAEYCAKVVCTDKERQALAATESQLDAVAARVAAAPAAKP